MNSQYSSCAVPFVFDTTVRALLSYRDEISSPTEWRVYLRDCLISWQRLQTMVSAVTDGEDKFEAQQSLLRRIAQLRVAAENERDGKRRLSYAPEWWT